MKKNKLFIDYTVVVEHTETKAKLQEFVVSNHRLGGGDDWLETDKEKYKRIQTQNPNKTKTYILNYNVKEHGL